MLLTNSYLNESMKMYRSLLKNGGGMSPKAFGEYQNTRYNTNKSKKRKSK